MRRSLLTACFLLSACMPANVSDVATRANISDSSLPPVKTFAVPQPVQPQRANNDIARDILDLAFRLESGRDLATFTRFEGPIGVRVTGNPPPGLGSDLKRLLHRLRSEAGIDISQVSGESAASITIQAVTRADIRSLLPQAACFVVPNVSSLAQYRLMRHSARVNWATLTERRTLSIFLPSDASPQEVRDCLHEELAQALGPLNDMYRLPDSVFNDDNVHTVLTGFDMMVLRAYYAPELRNGMTRDQVAARLPGILARINPQGEGLPSHALPRTPRAWIDAIQTALGPGTAPHERRLAAERSLQIASAMGLRDHRLAFSHYALGRLIQPVSPELAMDHFVAADRIYATTPGTELHRAYVTAQLAGHAINAGRGENALYLIAPHLATAERYENAALLSTLMMLRAEALDQTGRVAEGNTVRLDSLGWARYGFGSDWAVRAKLREIASLNPLKG
jgi:hypothetical protein